MKDNLINLYHPIATILECLIACHMTSVFVFLKCVDGRWKDKFECLCFQSRITIFWPCYWCDVCLPSILFCY